MNLQLVRKIEKIEFVFPTNPVLQVRYTDVIVDSDTGDVVAEKGLHRESFQLDKATGVVTPSIEDSSAPREIGAAMDAIKAVFAVNPQV